jgi:hypothetical protein
MGKFQRIIALIFQEKVNIKSGMRELSWMETDYIHKSLFSSCKGRIQQWVESTTIYPFRGGRYVPGGGIPNRRIGAPGPYIYHNDFKCKKCGKKFIRVIFQKKCPLSKPDLSEFIRESQVG